MTLQVAWRSQGTLHMTASEPPLPEPHWRRREIWIGLAIAVLVAVALLWR